jgi:UDP-3-O-[3-hydroxymyristoyl] glucosamine N-acyltransferase
LKTRSYRLCELADIVGGELVGDGEVEIRGVAGIREAAPGEITFVANPRYAEFAAETKASAVIVTRDLVCAKPLIRTDNPYFAYLQVLNLFAAAMAAQYPRGVHDAAVVDPGVTLGKNVSVGPFCHIGRGSRIGDNTTVLAGTFVGEDVEIGPDGLIYSNVTIRERTRIGARVILQPGVVLGGDGFGFARNDTVYHKIPQIGRVVLEDDVEIGANSCVDRATTGETVVRRGTKIDNLVQIAHNVVVGEDTVVAAQAGVSGSTEMGRNVVIGGQAGVAGHITVGDNATIGGQAGATKSVPEGIAVSGYPAREHGAAKRLYAYTAMLPALFERVKVLEKRLRELEKGGAGDSSTEDNR